jgi:RNA polymerase sigma-B factor
VSDHLDGHTSSWPDPRFAELRATGDRNVRNGLVEDHRWLAGHCVRRFMRKGEPTEDLEQVAVVGLVNAVDRFDPDLGFTFATYAVPTIMGELRRHFRDRTWSLHVPRRAKDNYLAVKAAVDELDQVLGRSSSVPELAEHADLSIKHTLEALEVGNSYRGVPLDGPGNDDGDQAWQLGVVDPGFATAEARVTIPGLLASLPTDRERRIVELRFVRDMSQSRIAAELGISQVHVSRLLRGSLEMMRNQLDG